MVSESLSSLPSNARVKRLTKEVVPFSGTDVMFGKIPYVENPDPILAYVALKDEEEYQVMERAEPTIFAAKKKRLNTLFSFETEVQAANNTKDALDLKDFAIAFLKNIRKWKQVQRLMCDASFWGWRPMECVWQFDMKWRGKPYWAPRNIYEKKPQHFRFTRDRDLVYVGKGLADIKIFNRWEDDLHWLVCTSGSTDNPYGEALYRAIWLIYYVKQQFFQKMSQGMSRSTGLIKAHQTADAASSLSGVASAKDVDEVGEEVRRILRTLDQKGVLVEKFGWELEILTNIQFSEAWMQPIRYCDELMNISLTGETLSMKLGDVGSRAAAQVHRDGLLDFCKSDAYELETTVNEELIEKGLTFNHGQIPSDLMPKFRSRIHQKMDVDNAQKLFAMGAPIDGERLASETGVPLALDGSPSTVKLQKPDPLELLAAQAKAKAAAGPQGAPPTGGVVPGPKGPDPKKAGKNPPAPKPERSLFDFDGEES